MLAIALSLALRSTLWASGGDLPKPASTDAEQLQTGIETEQKEAGSTTDVRASTDVVTPISPFAEKDLHQQALDELIKANNLLTENQYEAASDASLQAYDDLMDVHLKRKGHDRAKLLADRRMAAATYIQAGIAYIQEFAKRSNGSADAREETRSRLEDLRDVAREYPELMKKLDQAIAQYPPPQIP